MRLLDRYIAKQVLISSVFAVGVILIILILGNVFKEILRELAKRPDLDLRFVFKFIALVIPISLSLAVPFSFLTAILLTFGRLSADSEFISMRMAGLSMWRICLPVGVLALLSTGICAWVNLSITPAAKTEMEGMKDSFVNYVMREPMLIFPDKQVMEDNALPNIRLYADKEGSSLNGLRFIRMNNYLPGIYAMAEVADVEMNMDANPPELLIKMKNANLLLETEGKNFMESAQPVFTQQATVPFPLNQLGEGREDVRDQPENISLIRLFGKVADPSLEPEMRATYRTELSMRFAFSLSCITFGLIGVPLGITAQRREGTAGFIISMVIAVSYYVLLTLALIARENEALFPHILVWIPNLLFISLGFVMFWKLARK